MYFGATLNSARIMLEDNLSYYSTYASELRDMALLSDRSLGYHRKTRNGRLPLLLVFLDFASIFQYWCEESKRLFLSVSDYLLGLFGGFWCSGTFGLLGLFGRVAGLLLWFGIR